MIAFKGPAAIRIGMRYTRSLALEVAATATLCPLFALPAAIAADAAISQLASWNDREAKSAIIAFVERVTNESGPDFVAVQDRIAVFDNDGTLWSER
ncbi:hypothetical protein [Rhizobium hidalgonense]|uniref:hypothetical protein n=1 Tax=Rhizobium hidalgonense TaxID=1538159 RepID=UPI000D4E45E9|nr:hypothetical protein [Rhizobium hidalgonense]PON03855.1 hypothetical protein ATY29_29045 [Rhizobium hidalgonense]